MWGKGEEKETKETANLKPVMIGKDHLASFFGLCVHKRLRERFFPDSGLYSYGRITHIFCLQRRSLYISPSYSPSNRSALTTTCRWIWPGPSRRTPLFTPGGHWGAEQPGTRRPQLPSVTELQLSGYMLLISPEKTSVICPRFGRWTPISKARLLGKDKANLEGEEEHKTIVLPTTTFEKGRILVCMSCRGVLRKYRTNHCVLPHLYCLGG